MEGLIEGRIVHYVMPDGQHRPGIIVRVWDSPHPGLVNLIVFVDGTNDIKNQAPAVYSPTPMTEWKTSVVYSEDKAPGTWHWPERQ